MPKTIAIKLSKSGERMIANKHPWIFEDRLISQNKEGASGDLAIIFGKKSNSFLGFGLYDADSPIRIKMIQFQSKATFDQKYICDKINIANQKRTILLSRETNAYRVVFGENDGLPALIVDQYEAHVVVKIYATIWIPYLKWIMEAICVVLAPKSILLRLGRNVQKNSTLEEGSLLYGHLDGETTFKEHGIKFRTDLICGHKTGYFLDHRHNRHFIGAIAKDKSILDVFSYAGGFSVHALVGGAKEVSCIDINKKALHLAKRNAKLNGFEGSLKTMQGDAFGIMKKLAETKKKFDIVIVDPPALAKRSSEIRKAKISYSSLMQLAIPLVSKKGILLMCSCSSRITEESLYDLSIKVLAQSGCKFNCFKRTQHDVDHPIGFPEGAYLKSLYFELDK